MEFSDNKIQKLQKFYRPGVELPKERVDTPNDSIAMVEFGNRIQIFYVFHPEVIANFTELLNKKFDLDPSDVDKIILNNKSVIEKMEEPLRLLFESNKGVWQTRSIWPYFTFEDLQRRDIGRWFGADNPWIYDPPDSHSCLPGVPDDEANLLLFLIFSNAYLR